MHGLFCSFHLVIAGGSPQNWCKKGGDSIEKLCKLRTGREKVEFVGGECLGLFLAGHGLRFSPSQSKGFCQKLLHSPSGGAVGHGPELGPLVYGPMRGTSV